MSNISFTPHNNENHEELLTLSLSSRALPIVPPPPQPILSYTEKHVINNAPPFRLPTSNQRRVARRNPSKSAAAMQPGKTEEIQPPYPWATTTRATVRSLQYLFGHGINTITGRVQCKRCDVAFDMEYDLHKKWKEVAAFVSENCLDMKHRAPTTWMNPVLPDCRLCQQKNCVKPILSKKRSINWLFLLLGQMIGCCKLSELKYFCKHTKNHRTGAKDRVLYLTYMELCKQLDPDGRFV